MGLTFAARAMSFTVGADRGRLPDRALSGEVVMLSGIQDAARGLGGDSWMHDFLSSVLKLVTLSTHERSTAYSTKKKAQDA
jgi:hypothetical protein